jgi:hypothetical protein
VRWLSDRPALGVFVILLASYAFFWHSRDWNTASRLMLTYAIVDRGTVTITGLDRQTEDKAWFRGQYYSDKLPGYPLLAALPYFVAKRVLGLPDHPLNQDPFRYWAADYWITLGTSGILTAWTAALLVVAARELGCRRWQAGLIGLAYGLSTPAYVYATLAYGHQASAFALFASFLLLWMKGRPRESLRIFAAGVLAAYAAVIELQVGPVSAILAFFLLAQCLNRERRPDALAIFFVGALLPTVMLLIYNQLAFDSPWDMGYFHHATRQFAQVHNRDNPLGLRRPDWRKFVPLLWGGYRGLTFYAPILFLSIPGWVVLWIRRQRSVAIVSLLTVVAVFLVNLSYPEWTGGWSTGPRLLVPLLPFAMVPVAGLLAGNSRLARVATIIAMVLALAGGAEMLLFQGVGGRIPQFVENPLHDAVWPLWTTGNPLPWWRYRERFCCNLVTLSAKNTMARLDPGWQALQFLPLVLAQELAILGLWILLCAYREETTERFHRQNRQ